ncbi:Lrp/AsnC family transcriptional regulator [Burkholderia sp. FERM BP-3421]|jgi:DNA-binding Lrp family transcriptional regulator|uniref:Lrp/AsnC family transcriptional regulator n=1 Tax=Burkholderia sp. FERM BP-3421 TaxID=1494466 RepID=UPI0023616AD0|nr:Lrp/AsnC family transcriptional regulator [Burkholderia sp. FERM BP-3421]WDD92975.1 Lrp/AsnC family transcriptional regulator [Burkholderia sp. FERM BP-3421]
MSLDRTDLRILSQLENDGRISNQDLANAVALSPSACLRRVKLLEEQGIIDGYRCVISPKSIGVEFEALVHVSMRPDADDWHDKFVQALQEWPEVVSAQVVTGASNYVLTVRTRSLEHFSDFVMNRLHRATGVMLINSSIVLATLKRDGSVLELADKRV